MEWDVLNAHQEVSRMALESSSYEVDWQIADEDGYIEALHEDVRAGVNARSSSGHQVEVDRRVGVLAETGGAPVEPRSRELAELAAAARA
jgi:hypothetical protein